MKLTTELFGDIPEVDASMLDELLATDAFGKFAVLAASEDDYIQAGNDWQPGEECAAFLKRNDSDPWVLEYREHGQQYRATPVTLAQVRAAFREYLSGRREWRSGFVFSRIVG